MSAFEQTAEERRLLLERAKRRSVLRAEFLKQTSNPFRHGEGGTLVSLFLTGKHNPMSPTFHLLCYVIKYDIRVGFVAQRCSRKLFRNFKSDKANDHSGVWIHV